MARHPAVNSGSALRSRSGAKGGGVHFQSLNGHIFKVQAASTDAGRSVVRGSPFLRRCRCAGLEYLAQKRPKDEDIPNALLHEGGVVQLVEPVDFSMDRRYGESLKS